MPSDPSRDPGAYAHANWKAWQQDAPISVVYEAYLYTDAHITGQLSGDSRLGPFQLLNTAPYGPRKYGHLLPAVLVRVEDYTERELVPDMSATNTSRYHGGTLVDEVAALAALSLRCRFKAGAITRWFDPPDDRLGTAMAEIERPSLSVGWRSQMLPGTWGTRRLDGETLFRGFGELDASASIALVRSARSYSEAVWIADSQPELSWLFLVTALETAADHWHNAGRRPTELLSDHVPDLAARLADADETGELLSAVAKAFAPVTRSGYKYRQFIDAWRPDPPEERPPAAEQVNWSELTNVCKTVYGHRSKALHEGTPIPMPMCLPPFKDPQWAVPAERPVGSASSYSGAVWRHDDTPLLLHVFEYIVRGCLVNWWAAGCQKLIF